MHHWSVAVAELGGMATVLGMALNFISRAYAYLRIRNASEAANPQQTRKPPSPLPSVQGAADDALWKKGPEAVADYLFDVWYFVGMPEEWDSDERMWEVVDTKLKQLFHRDEDQLAFYERVQKRYQERLEETG